VDGEGRALPEVIENVVVGRVGSYVAFPLREDRFAPPAWRAALSADVARLLRASDESTVILPVRGVWLRVQLSAAMPEAELGMSAEDEERGEETGRRRGGRRV